MSIIGSSRQLMVPSDLKKTEFRAMMVLEATLMSLGQKIVRLRKQKNLQQKDLADQLGITARQLVRWERDQVRPRPKAIEQLAKFLGITVEEFTAEASPDSLDRIEDHELRELLSYIPELDPDRLQALKKLLKDVITCHQFTRFNERQARKAS